MFENILKVRATFFKDYECTMNNLKLPKGISVEGYLAQPFNTLVFYNNSVYYDVLYVTDYAEVKLI